MAPEDERQSRTNASVWFSLTLITLGSDGFPAMLRVMGRYSGGTWFHMFL